jgi:hypothetical protein
MVGSNRNVDSHPQTAQYLVSSLFMWSIALPQQNKIDFDFALVEEDRFLSAKVHTSGSERNGK